MSNLKTRVKHFYGSQEKHNLELVCLQLVTEGLDEKEALEHGWLYYDNEWYQCRSTRLEIARFKPKPLPSYCTICVIKEPTIELKRISYKSGALGISITHLLTMNDHPTW